MIHHQAASRANLVRLQQGPIIFQSYLPVRTCLDERRPTETETAEIDLDSCDILPRAHDRCKLPCLGQPWQLSPRPPDEVHPALQVPPASTLFHAIEKQRARIISIIIQITDYFERFYHISPSWWAESSYFLHSYHLNYITWSKSPQEWMIIDESCQWPKQESWLENLQGFIILLVLDSTDW